MFKIRQPLASIAAGWDSSFSTFGEWPHHEVWGLSRSSSAFLYIFAVRLGLVIFEALDRSLFNLSEALPSSALKTELISSTSEKVSRLTIPSGCICVPRNYRLSKWGSEVTWRHRIDDSISWDLLFQLFHMQTEVKLSFLGLITCRTTLRLYLMSIIPLELWSLSNTIQTSDSNQPRQGYLQAQRRLHHTKKRLLSSTCTISSKQAEGEFDFLKTSWRRVKLVGLLRFTC